MPVDTMRRGMAGLVRLVLFLPFACTVACGTDPAPVPPVSADAVQPGNARTIAPGAFPPDAPRQEAPSPSPEVAGLEPGGDLAALYLQAAELARAGLYDRAQDIYSRILAERPDHAPTLINSARVHFIRGRTAEAIELLTHSNRVAPGNPRTLAYLGMAEAKAGRFEDALIHLEGSFLLDPTRIDVGDELARVYLQLERFDDAVTAWNRVLELDPDNLPARAGLDRIRLQTSPPAPPQPQR
jgi:tetratricopeptide (TPR) repeat protein